MDLLRSSEETQLAATYCNTNTEAQTGILKIEHQNVTTLAVDKAENSEETTYQETSGAPVEGRSPLGYHVGSITIVR